MKQHNVYPECNVDTNLVGHILGGYAKHKSCCNEVVKAVNASDGFAVGIIDADKRLATMDVGFSIYEQGEDVEGRNEHLTMWNTLKYLMAKQYDARPEIAKQFFDGKLSNADLAELIR